jgi:hypothetical protein
MHQTNLRSLGLIFVALIFALSAVSTSKAEPTVPDNAKALMDEAKKKQVERKRSAMQKELDRLDEDLKQGQAELGDLEQNISRVGGAVNESQNNSAMIAGRRMNVTQDLELLALRAEAEKLKTEGLNLLNIAHAKTKEALLKRNEVLDIKRAIASAELVKADETQADSGSGRSVKTEASRTLTELRRNLAKAESKAELANYRAHDAMTIASKKLQQAEDATAKVEKKQAEFASQKPIGR